MWNFLGRVPLKLIGLCADRAVHQHSVKCRIRA